LYASRNIDIDASTLSIDELRRALSIIQLEKSRRNRAASEKLNQLESKSKERVKALMSGLHEKQRAFVESTHKRKTACCGRRSGKTVGVGRMLLAAAEMHPKGDREEAPIVGYVAPTKNQAKRLMWGRLQTIAKKHGIPLVWNSTDLIATHANGSQIWMLGADNARDIERMRGFAFELIVIDEAQAIGMHLKYLVEEIIDPALEDYDGTLAMTGTPNAGCSGLFHDLTNSDEYAHSWERHHWTVLDNSKFPRWSGSRRWREMARQHLEAKRRKWNWDEDNPSYLREWLGKWIKDFSKLMYKYSAELNGYDGAPPKGFDWRYIIGVDLGYDDPFAIVVIAYTEELPDVYQVYEFRDSGLIPSEWAEKVEEVRQRFRTDYIVVDSGGLGRSIIEEWRKRHNIPCIAARKTEKFEFATLLNDDMQRGRIHVIDGGILANEMSALQLFDNTRRTSGGFAAQGRPMEDPQYMNHCCDAFLYSWREARHWLHKDADNDDKPTPGEEMKEAARERAAPKPKAGKGRFIPQRELRRKVVS
jgi:hypothetical protein